MEPDGFMFSRRMVRKWAQNQVDRDFGKQGGNGALVPLNPDKPEPDPVPPMNVANDRKPVRPRSKGRETWAKRPRNVDETDTKLERNVHETDVKRR